jgi:hypothetical protein
MLISFYKFFKLYLLILSVINISPKLIEPEYNNGKYQDPNKDKSYTDISGQSLYYITRGSDKTMYNIVLNPNETLEVAFKIYTDSEALIGGLENGYKLYFGFDFMTENVNETLKQYHTDIIICAFDKKDVNCYDYVYDSEKKNYIRNDNGTISPNYIIPLGFENLTLNILTQNVIGYQHYYCVKFNKKFLGPYQNATLYKWVKYLPNDIIHKVTGFYGLIGSEEDLTEFSPEFPIYYSKLLFENGAGIKSNTLKNNVFQILSFLKYALILYITFVL